MKKIACALALLAALATDARATEDLYQTVGAAGGSNLYVTGIAIGVIADAYERKIYDADKATDLAVSIVGQAKVLRGFYRTLIEKNAIPQHDVSFMREMVLVYGLLIAEGEALVKYIKTGNGEHASEYHKNRTDAWTRIEKLLNMQ